MANKQITYRSILLKFSFLIICLIAIGLPDLLAQCPMCRAAAEQNLASGHDAARGLNNGILYLFATPYLIVMSLGIYWYIRNRQMEKRQQENLGLNQ